MNYVLVDAQRLSSNDFAGYTRRFLSLCNISQQDQDDQDCMSMPILKDALYFEVFFKPKSVADAPKHKIKLGLHDGCSHQNKVTADYNKFNTNSTAKKNQKELSKALSDLSMVEAMPQEELRTVFKTAKDEILWRTHLPFMELHVPTEERKDLYQVKINMSMKILRKFNYSDVKSASTPDRFGKAFVQDRDADDVDEHLYRSMMDH
ncbi:hypothetical protein Tco_0699357 [Tanacetum coccineum]